MNGKIRDRFSFAVKRMLYLDFRSEIALPDGFLRTALRRSNTRSFIHSLKIPSVKKIQLRKLHKFCISAGIIREIIKYYFIQIVNSYTEKLL